MMYKVIAWRWYSGLATVGVVVIDAYEGQLKAYIGPVLTGEDERADCQWIAAHGASLEPSVARVMFPPLAEKDWA